MSVLTVELPSALAERLEAAARAVPEEKARLVRVALENLLGERERGEDRGQPLDLYPFPGDPAFLDARKGESNQDEGGEARPRGPRRKPTPGSALELAGDLVGSVEGPRDLSTNPKYLEGFGQ